MNSIATSKIGDELLVVGGSTDNYLVEVTGLTATQVLTGEKRRWRKSDGGLVGGTGFHVPRLKVPTAEEKLEVARRNLAYRLSRYPWNNQTLAVLNQVSMILGSHPVPRKLKK